MLFAADIIRVRAGERIHRRTAGGDTREPLDCPVPACSSSTAQAGELRGERDGRNFDGARRSGSQMSSCFSGDSLLPSFPR